MKVCIESIVQIREILNNVDLIIKSKMFLFIIHTLISSSKTISDINWASDVRAARDTADANNVLCKPGLEM